VSTFLERARELDKRGLDSNTARNWAADLTGAYGTTEGTRRTAAYFLRGLADDIDSFRHCWPEILAVVEAAGNAHDQRYLHELLDALDALDRKAEDQ
jgi:hypothetical protein